MTIDRFGGFRIVQNTLHNLSHSPVLTWVPQMKFLISPRMLLWVQESHLCLKSTIEIGTISPLMYHLPVCGRALIVMLLLFLPCRAGFFIADLLDVCFESQVVAWLFSGKLVIDFCLKSKAEIGLLLSCKVDFLVHDVYFSSVSSMLSFERQFHLTPFLPLFCR